MTSSGRRAPSHKQNQHSRKQGQKPGRAARRRLPMRYLLPSLLLVALLAMLMLRGYVHSEILADHRVRPPAGTGQVPDRILKGGPVIDARGTTTPKALRVPDHKLVLTFRRRTGSAVDTEGPRRAEAVRRARRLLRHRHDGLAPSRPGPAHGRRGP